MLSSRLMGEASRRETLLKDIIDVIDHAKDETSPVRSKKYLRFALIAVVVIVAAAVVVILSYLPEGAYTKRE